MKSITLDRPALPVLCRADVVLVGGSLAGVAAAITLAGAGRKVALVEPRTYLGREVFATLRPWLAVAAGEELSALPEPIPDCLAASNVLPENGEVALHPDLVKIRLEDLLQGAAVRLIYASVPVGVVAPEGRLEGIVIANKSGRQVVACRAVVDATETGLVARLAGAGFAPEREETAVYTSTLEFDQVALADDVATLPVPANLGVADDRVMVHRGYRACGHMLLECRFVLPRRAATAIDLTKREVAAREKTVDVASYLLHQHVAFRLAYLAAVSYELHGPCTTPLAGPAPAWSATLPALEASIPAGSLAGPIQGLWCLDAARLAWPAEDPIAACRLAGSVARLVAREWPATAAPTGVLSAEAPSCPAAKGLEVREPERPQTGRHYEEQPVAPVTVPVVADVDVLTVGGGTGGAVAAIAAAREGARTFVVDMNPGLGGTGTYGAVDSYWIGYRAGFWRQVCQAIDRVHDHLRCPRLQGITPGWNIEAKAHALLQEARGAGAELLFNAVAFGAAVEKNAVRGVIVATRLGPVALLAKVTVDGTGDGDVAAFAGAESTYGSDRDHAVMWYSVPQFRVPGRNRNNFSSMVDVSDITDYTRALLAARRRGQIGQDHDHGIYVATRESRHIWGDVVETLTDQVLLRPWPDVINIALSNNDIKGQTDSDWLRCGMIPPQIEIETPFRALLPRGLENILVTGKAVSVTHDALPAIRMQPDFENLGGAAGLAAALAVRAGCTPRALNIRPLQEELVRAGCLPQSVLTRRLVPRRYTDAELEALVKRIIADDRPLHSYSNQELGEVWREHLPFVEVCCAGPRAVPLLEEALRRASGSARLRLAQALCLVGSKSGVPVLVSELAARLARRLPERKAFIQQVDVWAPDQCAMPEAAYLIYSLGMARDRRALPIWQRIANLLASTVEEDVWSQPKGVFYYVDAVCTGAEQLGDAAAIPLLRQLHGYAPFHGQQLLEGYQVSYLKERAAYLEVVIGRALARCGSPEGFKILIAYLDDVRGILATHACSALAAIAAQDLGRDAAAWRQWLAGAAPSLKPAPYLAPTDAMLAWKETILSAVPDNSA